MKSRTVSNFKKENHKPGPPEVKSSSPEPNYQERLLYIKDAHVVEDEGTEEDPIVKKTLWLLLQDSETNAIMRCPLTLEDVQSITGMSRNLLGRELYKFADELKMRDHPVKLIVDLNQSTFDTNMILAKKPAKSSKSQREIRQKTKFSFDPKKAQEIQKRVNHE